MSRCVCYQISVYQTSLFQYTQLQQRNAVLMQLKSNVFMSESDTIKKKFMHSGGLLISRIVYFDIYSHNTIECLQMASKWMHGDFFLFCINYCIHANELTPRCTENIYFLFCIQYSWSGCINLSSGRWKKYIDDLLLKIGAYKFFFQNSK